MNKLMIRLAAGSALVAALSAAAPAFAALDIGEKAPDFTAPAALAGKTYKFSLSENLAKGPVVLYFYPASFSVGCSAEAHTARCPRRASTPSSWRQQRCFDCRRSWRASSQRRRRRW